MNHTNGVLYVERSWSGKNHARITIWEWQPVTNAAKTVLILNPSPAENTTCGKKQERKETTMKCNKEDLKAAFIQTLESVKRPGMDKLLNWLEGTDFFTAPASTRYHGDYEGGLVQHSMNVYERLKQKTDGYDPDTVAVVALLHDVCKANFYKKGMKSQKDKEGKWQQVPFWGYNDQFPAGHGEKSVILIMRHIQLTDEEIMAINWHMGGFDNRAHGASYDLSAAWEKYPLAVLLHLADMEATWLDETERGNTWQQE